MTHSATLANTPITSFFREFERRTSGHDATAQAAQFADTFLAAGPQGAQCVRASDFAIALPKRKELFDKLGCRSTQLASLEETPLDARYTLVRSRWRMEFDNSRDRGNKGTRDQEMQAGPASAESQAVLVDSVFIVDTSAPEFKIILYLANQDIMAILKERGILAA